jgi:uncharacterized DUF497 family protein
MLPSSLRGRAGTESPVDFRSPASANALDGIGRTFERSRKRSAKGIRGVSRKAVRRLAPPWFRLRRVGLMQFVWDPAKAEANFTEHGIRFSEAVTVLEDDFALTREDPDSDEEQRFVTLGLSSTANLLVVVYTYRELDIIRIISAWRANRPQRLRYEKDRF